MLEWGIWWWELLQTLLVGGAVWLACYEPERIAGHVRAGVAQEMEAIGAAFASQIECLAEGQGHLSARIKALEAWEQTAGHPPEVGRRRDEEFRATWEREWCAALPIPPLREETPCST